MNVSKHLRILIILVMVLVNIGCDQVSKTIVRNHIDSYSNISLLHNHLTFTNIENTGAFLSWGNDLPSTAKHLLLSILPLIALITGFVILLTKSTLANSQVFALSCIIGGGIGNIFDRMVYGSVTDFLHLQFGFLQTGIFNLADVSIMAGTSMIIVQFLFTRKRVSD